MSITMDFITGIVDLLLIWTPALATLFLGAKAITVLTPTKADDKIVNGILAVLNLLALNVGKDKNADAG